MSKGHFQVCEPRCTDTLVWAKAKISLLGKRLQAWARLPTGAAQLGTCVHAGLWGPSRDPCSPTRGLVRPCTAGSCKATADLHCHGSRPWQRLGDGSRTLERGASSRALPCRLGGVPRKAPCVCKTQHTGAAGPQPQGPVLGTLGASHQPGAEAPNASGL